MTSGHGHMIGNRDAGPVPGRPVTIDDFGVLRHGDAWISLTPTQEVIMRMLVDRFGEAVGRDELAAVTWPDGRSDPHGIDVHVHRLRPRLKEMGLTIHTLRGRGFLLETVRGEPARRRR